METTASYGISHIAAQLAVSSTSIHIRATSPVTERIDFCDGIDFTEMVSIGVALADDDPAVVDDVLAIKGVGIVDVSGNAHQFLLLGSHRHTLEDAVVTAADSTTLISGKVDILGNFGVINIEEACDAVNGGSHIINRFILSCLDFMKTHGLFTDKSLETLQDKEQCADLFRHNSLKGILLCVNPNQPDDEQRKDANGNARYYSEKYMIAENRYFVSSEWRPDREDARKPLIDWIFALMQEIKFSTGYQSEFPRNRILFGAPGTGKSFTLNHEKDLLLADGGEYERVTFHPDYSYANFVGTYKPVPCKDSDGKDAITYSYVPGPFMRTYVKALQNSRTDAPKPFLLVIEEINRANVAAVFGDVFQLLDRGDDEVSEYPIQASEDIKKYLAGELGGNPDDYAEIRIPDNMFIWATMNSADQGVFPMDTAFKRRWDFTYLGIDDSEAGIVGKKVILGQGDYRRVVEWNALRKAINNELLTYKVNEDKLMGPYFISKKNLPEGEMIDPAVFTRIFKNKVIMYLFDDAAKQKRITLFGGCDEKAKNQYSKICREFDTKGVYIFCEGISSQFIDNVPEDDGE